MNFDEINLDDVDFSKIKLSSGTLDLDFNISDLKKFDIVKDKTLENYTYRYRKPIFNINQVDTKHISYNKAIECAMDLDLSENSRTFCIVSGSFIFGDLIEALILDRELPVKTLDINVLSLSKENIDSLVNIMEFSEIESLNLILSHYWYAHEYSEAQTYKNPDKIYLVDYLYDKLDKENKLQVAIAGTHMKTTLIECFDNRKFVMHGSANLRSSSNIEQFCFEENKELYNFNKTINDKIIEKYYTIKKEIRHSALFNIVKEVVDGKR